MKFHFPHNKILLYCVGKLPPRDPVNGSPLAQTRGRESGWCRILWTPRWARRRRSSAPAGRLRWPHPARTWSPRYRGSCPHTTCGTWQICHNSRGEARGKTFRIDNEDPGVWFLLAPDACMCMKTATGSQIILFQIQLGFKYLWYQNSAGRNFQHE